MRVLIAGGGTGGHLFPGIALAEEVSTRDARNDVVFIGTNRGLEARVVPANGYTFEAITSRGLKGMGPVKLLLGLLTLPLSLLESLRLLRKYQPDVVVGVGGYSSGPVVAAAWLLRLPTAVQEQNALPGLTNKVLGRFVKTVFLAFEEARRFFPAGKSHVIGNPIRRKLMENFLRPRPEASGPFTVLVFGGSLGAKGLNSRMLDALDALKDLSGELRFTHQTGKHDLEAVRAGYQSKGFDAEVVEFIDDMSEAYARSALVICRAGATTLAELTVCKKAAILVPFPFATDDHQAVNASALVAAGAAVMFREAELTGERLAQEIRTLKADPQRLKKMEKAAGLLGRPEASKELADVLVEMMVNRWGRQGEGAQMTGGRLSSRFKSRHAAHVHFVGIGGIGMSGIAEVLLNLGYQVSGSDLKESEVTRRLVSLRARIEYGHRAENLGLADVVVISSAVRPDNAEVVAARHRKIPVIPRAEMLAELMRLKYSVAIAGSHGKTTTTSMVASVLNAAGLDPTAVVGGKVNVIGSNARLGKSDLMVVEADESDGSFLKLHPSIAVVTNIDPEHMDHYRSLDALKAAFAEFCNRVPFYGLNVLCLDHPNVQALLPHIDKRVVTYGSVHTADYRVEAIALDGFHTRFRAFRHEADLGDFTVQMVGAHNAMNALAVIAVAEELDIPHDTVRKALADFQGVQRRFTVKGERAGITVVDDYGHHPAEVKATLAGARRAFGRRLVVAFQPHRYSRTHDLLDEFVSAFNDADLLFLTNIYAAGEEPIPGVSGQALADAVVAHGHRDVTFVDKRGELAAAMLPRLKEGDLVLTLGAGDITNTGPDLLALLEHQP